MREFLGSHLRRALSGVVVGLPFAASAQVLPDAGQALRELEQQPKVFADPSARSDEAAPLVKKPQASTLAAPAADEVQMEIKRFVVDGNTVIETQQLQELLQALEGQTLTLSQLEAGIARIDELYRERGYPFAYAYLPAQTVEDGVF